MSNIAIDFGTSNTVIARLDPDTQTPQTLKFDRLSRRLVVGEDQINVIPTLVFIGAPDQIQLGEEVRSQRLGARQPQRLFHSFKRDLVAEYVPPARHLDGQTYGPEQIATLFLQGLETALAQNGILTQQVIFTVPVGAFERYLTWIRDAAAALSFLEVQIVDESTAAALGYAVTHPGAIVLVMDLGGGTLDLSLVRTRAPQPGETVFKAEVIAKSDAYVGGVDIDRWIVEHYLTQIGSSRGEVGEVGWQTLLEIAERLKIQLSTQEQMVESWFDDETCMAHELELTRVALEEILESQLLLDQIRDALDETLQMAQSKGIGKSEIEQVLLVGGSCQIPAIQQLVTSYFGRKRVQAHNPFGAVAEGALVLSQQIQVQDYLRHTYAIRLWDPQVKNYTFYPLLTKGSSYPCESEDSLILQVANEKQTEIRLDIGEVAEGSQSEVSYDDLGRMTSRRLTRQTDFRSLSGGQDPICVAHLDPPGQAGVDRIRVRFQVDERRILRATVEDLLTQHLLVDRESVAKLD